MKKHNFRLHKMLKVKQLKQDIEEQKLATSKQHLDQQRNHLAELKERKRNFLDQLKEKRLTTSRGHEIQKYSSYQRQVEKYVEQQDQNVKVASEAVDKQRSNLIQAAQETNMIDKLKERAFEQYRRRMDSVEQKQVDELSQLKPFRDKE